MMNLLALDFAINPWEQCQGLAYINSKNWYGYLASTIRTEMDSLLSEAYRFYSK